jgi:DNA-binding MarR family transcriptional regulator
MQLLRETTHDSASAANCAEQLLLTLPPVMRFVRSHMRSHRNKGLSIPQFRTLVLLQSAPTTNLSGVADFLGSSLPTASRIVSCLVSKKFVHRRECPCDRRQVELLVTSRGAAMMQKSRTVTQQMLANELQTLPAEQRGTVLSAMKALHELFTPNVRSSTRQNQVKANVRPAEKTVTEEVV